MDGIENYIDGFTDDDYPIGDGLRAYEDYDSDGDHIYDVDEGFGNPDYDGLPNYLDRDSDDDCYSDTTEHNFGSDSYDDGSTPEPLPVSGAMNPLYHFAVLALCLAYGGGVVLR